jgi:hypothetical protein
MGVGGRGWAWMDGGWMVGRRAPTNTFTCFTRAHRPSRNSVFMLLCWMAALPSALAVALEGQLMRKRLPDRLLVLLAVSVGGAGE